MTEILESFMNWHQAQPVWVQFYVNYVIVRSIIIKFVSDETKRWLVEPFWRIIKAGLSFLARPLTRYALNWYARRDFSSMDRLRPVLQPESK